MEKHVPGVLVCTEKCEYCNMNMAVRYVQNIINWFEPVEGNDICYDMLWEYSNWVYPSSETRCPCIGM